ncbi:MAG: hypothetical protein EBS07_12520 [Sphingobacteriia bacterium]|nr:hypothetical protein [Sphingobacteriia bacterium]
MWRFISGSVLCAGLTLTLGLPACKNKDSSGEEIVAKFRDVVLKRKDLEAFLPGGFSSPEDSLRITRMLIDQWLGEQAMTESALEKIEGLADRVEFKVINYRNKLILQEYFEFLYNSRVDTTVDSITFQAYYQRHKEKFINTENRYQYVFVGTYQYDLRKPQAFMTRKPIPDYPSLETWSRGNAFTYKADSTWLTQDWLDTLSSLYRGNLHNLRGGSNPVSWTNLHNGKPAQYLFKMIKVLEAGDTLPPEMVKQSIFQGILTERRKSTIEGERNRLLKDAKTNGEIFVP